MSNLVMVTQIRPVSSPLLDSLFPNSTHQIFFELVKQEFVLSGSNLVMPSSPAYFIAVAPMNYESFGFSFGDLVLQP